MIKRATSLDNLFPKPVACVVSSRPPENFELLPEERNTTGEMTPLRLREFEHGRSCARRALAQLGYPDCPVPAGADRVPEWPAGVVGSISHCGDTAAAAVALATDVDGIGLDIETSDGLDEDLLPLICRDDELAQIDAEESRLRLAKLLFSAKESVFKCIWPRVRRFVDFQEVEIRMNLDDNTFIALPDSSDLPTELFCRIRGRFGETQALYVTTACIVLAQ